ncbi:uncharacterized protein [Heterodontus francisci]|uniref:uncharacterized protein n=1 Tax=Heterodontus francisci TaxID=7792 RepID=UPI00355C8CEA
MGNKISKQNTPRGNQIPEMASSSFTSFQMHRKYPAVSDDAADGPGSKNLSPRKASSTESQTKGKDSSLKASPVTNGIIKSQTQTAESALRKWLLQGISAPASVLGEGSSALTVPTTASQASSVTSADVVPDVTTSAAGMNTRSNQASNELSSTRETQSVKPLANQIPTRKSDRAGLSKNIKFMHLESHMMPGNKRPEFHFYPSALDGPPNYYFWYSPYWQIQDTPPSTPSTPTTTKPPPAAQNPAGKSEPMYLESIPGPLLQHTQLCSYLARTRYDEALYDIFFHVPDPYISNKELMSVPDEDAEFWGTLHFTGINAARDLLSRRRFEKICAEILSGTKTGDL